MTDHEFNQAVATGLRASIAKVDEIIDHLADRQREMVRKRNKLVAKLQRLESETYEPAGTLERKGA